LKPTGHASTRPLVLLDIGVWVAAHISPQGAPAQIFRRWLRRDFDIVVSEALLIKLGQVLARSKFAKYTDPESTASYLWVVRRFGTMVEQPASAEALTGDAEDDQIVALGLSASVDRLVSGDPHILTAKLPVTAIKPSAFLADLPDESR
jgi:putative PIN family toxin of toxin-antitoxin system